MSRSMMCRSVLLNRSANVRGVRVSPRRVDFGSVGWVQPTDCQGIISVGCTHPTTVEQGFWDRHLATSVGSTAALGKQTTGPERDRELSASDDAAVLQWKRSIRNSAYDVGIGCVPVSRHTRAAFGDGGGDQRLPDLGPAGTRPARGQGRRHSFGWWPDRTSSTGYVAIGSPERRQADGFIESLSASIESSFRHWDNRRKELLLMHGWRDELAPEQLGRGH
jgi:hypothetical protein